MDVPETNKVDEWVAALNIIILLLGLIEIALVPAPVWNIKLLVELALNTVSPVIAEFENWLTVCETANKLLLALFKYNPELLPNVKTLAIFKVELHVEAFWNIDVPETNKVDINVHGWFRLGIAGDFSMELQFKLVNAVPHELPLTMTVPITLIVDEHVIVPFNLLIPNTFKLFKIVQLVKKMIEMMNYLNYQI